MTTGEWLLAIVVILVLSIAHVFISRGLARASPKDATIGLSLTAIVVGFGIFLLVYGDAALHSLYQTAGSYAARVVVALSVCIAGVGAVYFKRTQPWWYGLSEMLFGVILAVKVASGLSAS